MENKINFGLINLPFDNNYGGNLQRYALIKVLSDLGCHVEHIYMRKYQYLPWYLVPYKYLGRILLNIFRKDNKPIRMEKYINEITDLNNNKVLEFYNKYIPHTRIITSKNDLLKLPLYDAYIVGSDQVWRKSITRQFGLDLYFLNFLNNNNVKRYAYAVSFGSVENELTAKDFKKIENLYHKFNMVSVREKSGLDLIMKYGWTVPKAIQCLDPTLLLNKEDYVSLIEKTNTHPATGNLFCYILDYKDEYNEIIAQVAKEKGLVPFMLNLNNSQDISIEQWLRYFNDAEYVITDSYHGTVFSIIFNKCHLVLENEKRGNARIQDLHRIFVSSNNSTNNACYNNMKKASINFLKQMIEDSCN